MPNTSINTGNNASAEVCLKICRRGSINLSNFLNHPITSPSGIATKSASAKPAADLLRLTNTFSKREPLIINCHNAANTLENGGRKTGLAIPIIF